MSHLDSVSVKLSDAIELGRERIWLIEKKVFTLVKKSLKKFLLEERKRVESDDFEGEFFIISLLNFRLWCACLCVYFPL